MDLPLLPFENGTATRLDAAEISSLIDRIRDEPLKLMLNAQETIVERYDLPFYEDVTLLSWTNADWKPSTTRICFLDDGENLIRLLGASPPIHEINARKHLLLSRGTALSYLAFFCYFVRGDEGPFFVLDRIDNPFLPASSKTSDLEAQFRTPVLWGQAPNGSWRASSLVYYSNAVFMADFLIQLGGLVEMVEDTPVLSDLQDKIVAPLELSDDTHAMRH